MPGTWGMTWDREGQASHARAEADLDSKCMMSETWQSIAQKAGAQKHDGTQLLSKADGMMIDIDIS